MARPALNLFGIKAGEEWKGARVIADTMEFSNGVATPRRTAFRAYGSIEESVSDFANLLKNSPRFGMPSRRAPTPSVHRRHSQNRAYATDPEYANKLNQVVNGGLLRAALLPRTAAL